ncbi:zona pellucida protein C [Xyrichtys novacula]|uniref:Zona pellucida protein C n=1 Tax=Xyrichtys novacula TaxID=13765 RepID=A0AAV1GKD2_XYRNO|nr:zona pellucida protein C [Xyrichtys novacula]
MGTIEIVLCVFLGHVIAVQSVIINRDQDATYAEEFLVSLDSIRPFPVRTNSDFFANTLFNSLKSWSPEFPMLSELPPFMNIPTVEVFCDESTLTVLVNKRSNGVMLTGEELWLGNGCTSSGELPNHFVFTYLLDECGTTEMLQNGNMVFTNSLHLNLRSVLHNQWLMPSTVHISCIPKRLDENSNSIVSMANSENGKTINIKAMNPSWTNTAESNMYKRGQNINLQVSARTRPKEQLYLQSCFVSPSPDPQVKPRHAVIMNKGCTAPLGSPHAVVQFVASKRPDVVNFVLNTSFLISELYIHCSVLVSDQGVTFGTKSCNYNVFQSRWEDLSGRKEVCKCCSSKCRGLSIKHVPEDSRVIVSTGPFVIEDKEVATSLKPSASEPQTLSAPDTNLMQADDAAAAKDTIVSGTTFSRYKPFSSTQGVMVISEDPVARLTLWLPGQLREPDNSKDLGNEPKETKSSDTPELQPSTTEQEPLLNVKSSRDQGLSFLTLVDGWVGLPHLEEAAIAEESRRKRWFGRSGMLNSEPSQDVGIQLPAEITLGVLGQNDFNQKDELTESQVDADVVAQEEANDAQPFVRSKLQFSKHPDGSQTVSYEEEVKHKEARGTTTRFGMNRIKGQQEHKHGRMFSAFLDLLRRIDKE